MKIIEIEVSADATRSKDYQSYRAGTRVKIALSEGENKTEALRQAALWVRRETNRAAQEGLEAVIFGDI